MSCLDRGDLLVGVYHTCFSIVFLKEGQDYRELVFSGDGKITPYDNFIHSFEEARQKGYVLHSRKGIVYESGQ